MLYIAPNMRDFSRVCSFILHPHMTGMEPDHSQQPDFVNVNNKFRSHTLHVLRNFATQQISKPMRLREIPAQTRASSFSPAARISKKAEKRRPGIEVDTVQDF